MKGLLIKDALLIKKHCIFHLIISAVFFTISVADPSQIFFSYYAVSMAAVTPITISAYDEQCKWTMYEAILPVSRKQIVLEKYLVSLCIIIPLTVLYSVLSFIIKGENVSDMLLNAALMLLCGVMPPAIILPIIFKFGYLKGRVINFIVIAVIAALISFTSLGYNITAQSNQIQLDTLTAPAVFAAVAAVFALSLLISQAVYRKKEF